MTFRADRPVSRTCGQHARCPCVPAGASFAPCHGRNGSRRAYRFSEAPKRNKLILEPLLPLKTGFWEIIIVDLFPDEIKKSELFVKIRDIDMLANKINEHIKSRQNYMLIIQKHNQVLISISRRQVGIIDAARKGSKR